MKGFTLVEIIITVTLFIFITLITIPIVIRFFEKQTIDEVTRNISIALHQKRTQALYQKNNSSHGIYFTQNSYVLFEGNNYQDRNIEEDVIVPLSSFVTVSGFTEIVFAKRTGVPNLSGTLLIQLNTLQKEILINNHGIIQ